MITEELKAKAIEIGETDNPEGKDFRIYKATSTPDTTDISRRWPIAL